MHRNKMAASSERTWFALNSVILLQTLHQVEEIFQGNFEVVFTVALAVPQRTVNHTFLMKPTSLTVSECWSLSDSTSTPTLVDAATVLNSILSSE